MDSIVPILYMGIALLAVYPLRRVLAKNDVSSREAALAAVILSPMWVAIVLYGGIAWCVSADARRGVTYPWQRKNTRVRAAATRSLHQSSTSSVEAPSSAQSAG